MLFPTLIKVLGLYLGFDGHDALGKLSVHQQGSWWESPLADSLVYWSCVVLLVETTSPRLVWSLVGCHLALAFRQ